MQMSTKLNEKMKDYGKLSTKYWNIRNNEMHGILTSNDY